MNENPKLYEIAFMVKGVSLQFKIIAFNSFDALRTANHFGSLKVSEVYKKDFIKGDFLNSIKVTNVDAVLMSSEKV